MNVEFTKTGPNRVSSAKGFTVTFHPQGGVDYADVGTSVRVDTELLVKPLMLRLYRESKSLGGMTNTRADEILHNIQRALEYLGHPVEISQPY
jgi:hypothetical protein